MAAKPVVTLAMIKAFFGDYFSKAIERGENALLSGHLLQFSYHGEFDMIRAKVHASQRNTSYVVYVSSK